MTALAVAATDHDLVAAARQGDDRAFEELYARYRKRITGYCIRLTQDADRAEDIAQEVFISALRRLRQTDRPIVFRPWIYEIARNACIDEYRRRSRAREISIDHDGDSTLSSKWAVAPPPEVTVESKQQLHDLRGAFRGLSERHHRIIVLREFEGRSYSEIGDELGMSKVVVESTLFRARRRLTEEYEDLSSGRRCADIRQMLASQPDRPLEARGLRERRVLSRHLEHCASCRREANASALEVVVRRRPVTKVAALLPLPLIRFPGRLWSRAAAGGRSAGQAALPAASTAARYSDAVVSVMGTGRAAATAATLFAAAVGGGIATSVGLPTTQAGHPPASVAFGPPSSLAAAAAALGQRPGDTGVLVATWSSTGGIAWSAGVGDVAAGTVGGGPAYGTPGGARAADGQPSQTGVDRSGAPGPGAAGAGPGWPGALPSEGTSLPGSGTSGPDLSGSPASGLGGSGSGVGGAGAGVGGSGSQVTGSTGSAAGAAGTATGAASGTWGTASGSVATAGSTASGASSEGSGVLGAGSATVGGAPSTPVNAPIGSSGLPGGSGSSGGSSGSGSSGGSGASGGSSGSPASGGSTGPVGSLSSGGSTGSGVSTATAAVDAVNLSS